jgi:hypothetical protein
MDTEIATRLSKHMLRLATETLATIQNDPDLSHLCEQGMDPNISHGELQAAQRTARSLCIFGNYANETPKHRGAAVVQHALAVRMYGMEGEYHEAWLNLCTYPNAYAILQTMEGGGSYDSMTPEGRDARRSVMSALIARCAAFSPEFAAA